MPISYKINNNRIDVEGCKKLAKSLHTDVKELQNISDIIDECKNVTDAER